MTEEKARLKLCPIYMINMTNLMMNNPSEKETMRAVGFCSASDCMMWRWDDEITRTPQGNGVTLNELGGYCGLAGKPNA